MPSVRTAPIYTRIATLQASCPWHLLTAEDPAFLWRGARSGEVWFGLGSLAEFASLEALRDALRSVQCLDLNLTPRGFGVVAFDGRSGSGTVWNGFPAQRFVLPSCQLRWSHGTATVLALAREHSQLSTDLRRVMSAVQHPPAKGAPDEHTLDEQSLFTREAWRRAVERVQHDIRHEQVKKLVLARQMHLRLPQPLNAAALLEQLADDAAESHLFAYRQRNGGVFLGATPERLFEQQRGQLRVDSLAGTRPRGVDAEEDRLLAQELRHSAKDVLEQRLVTEHIVAQMQTLCDDVVIESAPQVRKLHAVQHLSTVVEGTLRDRITLDQMLAALHPTPATCGVPMAPAQELIAELEPEPRGLYAGVIGWVDVNHADFAVAIRSGWVNGSEVRLFAGAGIMATSDPDAEYDECEWKLLTLRRALLKTLA